MVEDEVKEFEVRCKKCNRRLFDFLPGDLCDRSKTKPIEIICPRCKATNIITVEIYEKIVVKLKE